MSRRALYLLHSVTQQEVLTQSGECDLCELDEAGGRGEEGVSTPTAAATRLRVMDPGPGLYIRPRRHLEATSI